MLLKREGEARSSRTVAGSSGSPDATAGVAAAATMSCDFEKLASSF